MSNHTTDFNPVEARLKALLHPVHPSSRLVQTMRQRIQVRPPVEISRKLERPPATLLVLGGVLSVSLLIITVVRALFYLSGRSKA